MAVIFTTNAYPYKHWLTTLAVAPLIICFQDIISDNNNLKDEISMYVLFATFGLFFSLPAFIVYLLLFNLLIKKTNSAFIIKAILNLLAIAGVCVTLKEIDGTTMTSLFVLYYSATIIICSLFYKIEKQKAVGI